jgi:vacuolar protein sorting-associated protein IST1
MPSANLVDAYLEEIAKAYGVNWSTPHQGLVEQKQGLDGGPEEDAIITTFTKELQDKIQKSALVDAKSSGGQAPKLPDIPPTEDQKTGAEEKDGNEKTGGTIATEKASAHSFSPPEDDFEALTKRFEALKKR